MIPPVGWQVTAQGTRITAAGYVTTWQVPTFIIPSIVHGVTHDVALEVAHEILGHGRPGVAFDITLTEL